VYPGSVTGRRAIPWCLALALSVAGCDCGGGGGDACTTASDCAGTELCIDGECVAVDGGTGDGGPGGDDGAAGDGGCAMECGADCCSAEEVCVGGSRCAEDFGPCTGDDDCPNDSYCEPSLMRCIPYGEGRDVAGECGLLLEPGLFRTSVQCEWTGPPPGDPYPDHVHVESTPLVVDFAIGRGPDDPPAPSIVFVATDRFTYVDGGVIRILDGSTCEQVATLADPFVQAAGTPAVGDLDGDGRADVASAVEGGGVAAWGFDAAAGAWTRLFRSADTSATAIHSVSIADVDADGDAEVLAGGLVYAADGTLESSTAGQGEITCSSYAPPAVVGDVDHDDLPELVQGTAVWTWDPAAGDLAAEPAFTGGGAPGFTAVADFGDFPGVDGDAPGRPEVAVVTRGRVQVHTVAGVPVFGPVALPGAGDGGNPTVADFDGDDVPEVGAGGPGSYTVFDLACVDGGGPGECASGRTDGILWTRPVQDTSCGINGSTVFDFEGDGRAEVVYSDECYDRGLVTPPLERDLDRGARGRRRGRGFPRRARERLERRATSVLRRGRPHLRGAPVHRGRGLSDGRLGL